LPRRDHHPRLFLAGSIEMGAAEDWQTRLTGKLLESGIGCDILNPRRDDWDSSWRQSIDDPQFSEQVRWELNAMERSDVICFYFSPGTQSPITLLELGLWARDCGHTTKIVCCPDGFWRKGNVDVVCDRYGGMVQVPDLDALYIAVVAAIARSRVTETLGGRGLR
jgi:hypothetical protein